jgi:ATP-dependent RNA helicase DOB1
MYNLKTEDIIRQVPEIDGSETKNLPQYLTKVYAKIVSVRKRVNSSEIISEELQEDISELRKLANNLESLTILNQSRNDYVSAAFVAGTAHNLLQMIRDHYSPSVSNELGIQVIPSWISSILLFLIGESPADAAEIAGRINVYKGDTIQEQLSNAIIFLAQGKLGALRSIQPIIREYNYDETEIEAQDYLWLRLLLGVQRMADSLLGITNSPFFHFEEIIALSEYEIDFYDDTIKSLYSGPYHLSILLNLVNEKLLSRGVINVKPPLNMDSTAWTTFLKKLAESRPYLWQNHYEAVQTGFLNSGNSAVMTFPTGAGKTTIAELKIASSIMSGSSVLYLVPTHALEDQINRDLKTLFDYLDTDLLEIGGEFTDLGSASLEIINVMTPERCLTLLAMNPDSFENIGLVVFDEFHLINGRTEKIDKRSLDAMYCLLKLFVEVPKADYLLISAMVENGEEIASWIAQITERNCLTFDSKWKPTRQLHGCVIYPSLEINKLENEITQVKSQHTGKTVPKSLKDKMLATPHQIYNLRNIWNPSIPPDFFVNKLFNNKVKLEINPRWQLTTNRNEVAAELAAFFIKSGIKTLVFVSSPIYAISTAKKLNDMLDERNTNFDPFIQQNARRLKSLELELGSLNYSFFNADKQIASHHGLLLPIERQLNELLFRFHDGIHGIVATATLAQGINLPAEVVIIAGDDRFDEDTEVSEKLLAHEILNAAGRAGRAGTAAQGVVILVPGQVISFSHKFDPPISWVKMQQRVFSKSDQCLTINDPITQFLDEVSAASAEQELRQDLNSLLLRLNATGIEKSSIKNIFNKSFSAFKAKQAGDETFAIKVEKLIVRRDNLAIDLIYDDVVEIVSLKTGIDPNIVQKLQTSLLKHDLSVLLGFSVIDWTLWFFHWLKDDEIRILEMFPSSTSRSQLARALGLKAQNYNLLDVATNIIQIVPILTAFINGKNYEEINNLIPGRPDQYLSKARNFILKLVPQISFAIGVLSVIMKEHLIREEYEIEEIPFVIKNLASLVKEGFDNEEKLHFKIKHRTLLRVQIHNEFKI